MHQLQNRYFLFLLFPLCTLSCGEGREAVPVELSAQVSPIALPSTDTDLGYTVEISSFRMAIEKLQFTILGEAHSGVSAMASPQINRLFLRWLLKPAYAHPGHAAGGEVTGELPGRHIVDWTTDAKPLGIATLLTGVYKGANFTFSKASESDGISPDDKLAGHTAHIVGIASKDEKQIAFEAIIDVAENAQLVGAPFELDVTEGTSSVLAIEFFLKYEKDTLFDGVDFAALDSSQTGSIEILSGSAEYNRIGRALRSHIHYKVVAQ